MAPKIRALLRRVTSPRRLGRYFDTGRLRGRPVPAGDPVADLRAALPPNERWMVGVYGD